MSVELDPVEGVLGVLDDGAATGTNKFALLLALIDLAPTVGEDGTLAVQDIAAKLLEIHWEHARHYDDQVRVLRQLTSGNRDNTTAVLEVLRLRGILADLGHGEQPFESARELIDETEWEHSIRKVARDTKRNPLRYLQRINRADVPFLYRMSGSEIVFEPDSVQALVRFGPVLRDLIEFRYVRFVVSANRLELGSSHEEQVAGHLFGVDRHMPPEEMRRELWRLQNGACVYTGRRVDSPGNRGGSLDHVLPWSRARLSAIENLVLTSRSVNSAKSNLLLAPTLIEKWAAHLTTHRDDLREIADRHAWPADVSRVAAVMESVYRHAAPGSAVWAGATGVTPLDEEGKGRVSEVLAGLRGASHI